MQREHIAEARNVLAVANLLAAVREMSYDLSEVDAVLLFASTSYTFGLQSSFASRPSYIGSNLAPQHAACGCVIERGESEVVCPAELSLANVSFIAPDVNISHGGAVANHHSSER